MEIYLEHPSELVTQRGRIVQELMKRYPRASRSDVEKMLMERDRMIDNSQLAGAKILVVYPGRRVEMIDADGSFGTPNAR
jgi:hypothetical protein